MAIVSPCVESAGAAEGYRVVHESAGLQEFQAPIINNAGQVVFVCRKSTTRTTSYYKGGLSGIIPVKEYPLVNPPGISGITPLPGSYSLNNAGVVALLDRWAQPGNVASLLVGAGSLTTNSTFQAPADTRVFLNDNNLVQLGGRVGSLEGRNIFGPGSCATAVCSYTMLNNRNQFLSVSVVDVTPDGFFRHRIERIDIEEVGPPDNSALRPVRTNLIATVESDLNLEAVMNDNGVVAFLKRKTVGDSSDVGLYRSSGDGTTRVFEGNTSDPFFEFFSVDAISINNLNQVAFFGFSRTLRKYGFFRGPNPLSDKIVAEGDIVADSVIRSLGGRFLIGMTRGARYFNDAGQIVFVAQDGEGFDGIWVTAEGIGPPPPTPATIRYVGPSSETGSFGTVSNWQPLNGDPPRVPEKTETRADTILFDKPVPYTVEVGTRHAERMIVRNGTPALIIGSLRLDAVSTDAPSVQIDSAHLILDQGIRLTNNHATIGMPLAARVDVGFFADIGFGPVWDTKGSLRVGGSGEGFLNVRSGGVVKSAESRIGTEASGGRATVEGGGASWTTGNIAIGAGGPGELRIADNGSVDSDLAVIGLEPGLGNLVTVRGAIDEVDRSRWNIILLDIGAKGFGRLEVLDGGFVEPVIARIGTRSEASGSVKVSGVSDTSRSTLYCVNMTVGHGGVGSLDVEDGGMVFVVDNAEIGKTDTSGTVTVDGVNAASLFPSILQVSEWILMGNGRARLDIQDGGEVEAKNLYLGAAPLKAERNEVLVSGADAYLTLEEDMWIGLNPFEEQGRGVLTLLGGNVEARELAVFPAGVVQGFGVLTISSFMDNGGSVDPGLLGGIGPASAALAGRNAPEPAARSLTIQGKYRQQAGGRLLISVGGTNSAAYDQLVVTKEAELDGQLTFKFINGFAPRTGDKINFLNVGGLVTGSFARVDLQNLAPGFQFNIAPAGAGVSLTALNDAVFDPSLPGRVEATVTNVGGITYALYDITTSNTCHRIELDGPVTRAGNVVRQGFVGTRFDQAGCSSETKNETGALVLGALRPGDYTLELTAGGQVVQSIPFNVPAGSAQTLRNPTRLADGRLRFEIDGLASVPFRVEVSQDLIQWVPVRQGQLPAIFTESSAASTGARFYRAILGP